MSLRTRVLEHNYARLSVMLSGVIYIREEYVLCTQLETTTRAAYMMGKLSSLFNANRIPCCGVCTDGTLAIKLGAYAGAARGLSAHLRDIGP